MTTETRYTSRAIPKVRAIQASMSEQAAKRFADAEIEEMKVVIRLTVEFAYYLQYPSLQANQDDVDYIGDSIFGVESFQSVVPAYRVLARTVESDFAPGELSADWLVKEFTARYSEFTMASDFAKQCRLLLDLFKIQIIYAGLTYGCPKERT